MFLLAPIGSTGCRFRVINELAWHSLFARTMFISEADSATPHQPEFTIINLPGFQADPQRDGTRSSTFILMDFSPATGSDWWYVIRRRDKEERIYFDELSSPAKGRDEHALFCKRRH
jgi:hypothetical protein